MKAHGLIEVFTPEQVQHLRQYQFGPWAKPFDLDSPLPQRFHPFTCPHRGDGRHFMNGDDTGILIPTVFGFICTCCNYTQHWVHPFMTGGEQRVATQEEIEAATQIAKDLNGTDTK